MSETGARLVGRTTEVARAVEVAAGNTPEIAVLIEGAPGIGKAVVLQAAIDAAAAAGAVVLQTRPSEAELRMPLLGLHDLLEIHLRLAAVVGDPDEAAVHLSLGTSLPDAAVAGALEAAASRGLARGATIDAIDQLDRTIQLTPEGHDDDLVRRRLLLVRALILAGDTRRAGAELDALGVDAIGDLQIRAEAVLRLGVVQRYLGEHAAAIERYEDALRWVTETRTRARLHLRLAWLTEWSMDKSLEHADGALALLDPDEAPLDYSFALLTATRVRLHLGIAVDHEAIARGEELQEAGVERDWNVSTTPIDCHLDGGLGSWPGPPRRGFARRRGGG